MDGKSARGSCHGEIPAAHLPAAVTGNKPDRHARFLAEEKKAHYVFTVQRNQRNLHRRLAALPWEKTSAKFYDGTDAHGRLETRVVLDSRTQSVARVDVILLSALRPPPSALRPRSVDNPCTGGGVGQCGHPRSKRFGRRRR